jgi:hypothetical protein
MHKGYPTPPPADSGSAARKRFLKRTNLDTKEAHHRAGLVNTM